MIWVIIQARSTSKRLPNKCMADICGKPMIGRVVDICSAAHPNVCVAVPYGDGLIGYLRENHILFCEGDEDDVLSRYWNCAKSLKASAVVRITTDCPLLPVSQIKAAIDSMPFDFYTNLPTVDGYDVEGMSLRALEWANNEALEPGDREHVTTFLKKNCGKMVQLGFSVIFHREPWLTEWFPKLSIDTQEDLERVRGIYEKLVSARM